MANLKVRDLADNLYDVLKQRANSNRRSLSQEVVHILQDYLSHPHWPDRAKSEMFLELSGAWEGAESAEEIIGVIRKGRIDSGRLKS